LRRELARPVHPPLDLLIRDTDRGTGARKYIEIARQLLEEAKQGLETGLQKGSGVSPAIKARALAKRGLRLE